MESAQSRASRAQKLARAYLHQCIECAPQMQCYTVRWHRHSEDPTHGVGEKGAECSVGSPNPHEGAYNILRK